MAVLKNISRELISLRKKNLYGVPKVQGGFSRTSAGRSLTTSHDLLPLNHSQLSWLSDLCQWEGTTHVVSYIQSFQVT